MNWNPFKKKDTSPSEKKSAGQLDAILRGTKHKNLPKKSTPIGKNYESISENGYLNTQAVYTCCTLIAEKAGTVPIKLVQKGKTREETTEIFSHPILDLVKNPSRNMDWQTYLQTFISYYFLDGNAYQKPIQVNTNNVSELQLFSPKDVKILTNEYDVPIGYQICWNGKERVYKINRTTLDSDIKHMHNFHPLHPYKGVSILSSASTSIDIQNSGDVHNYNTLTNQARPSGALSYEPGDGQPAQMDDEQFERLKEEINQKYSGDTNSGRPLLLEGGLKWVQMSLSAKDLDYLNARGVSQKDVYRAFKVPPVLLGLDNDSTYNNIREARLGLWDDAVAPTLSKVLNHWNKFILPLFEDSENLELQMDLTDIPDLETRAQRVWDRINKADMLTLDEKRLLLGYDPLEEGGDTIIISSGDMPYNLITKGITAGNINEIVQAGAVAEGTAIGSDDSESADDSKSFELKKNDEDLYREIDALTVEFEKAMNPDVLEFNKKFGKVVEKAIISNQELGAEFALIHYAEKFAEVLKPHMEDIITTFGEKTLTSISEKSNGRFEYKQDELIADVLTTQEATNVLLSSAWTARVAQYVERESLVRAKFVEDTNRNAVRKILSEGIASGKTYAEMAKEANEFIADDARSMTIVRTEVHSAREYGSFEAASATGIETRKRWLSSIDERVRTTHIAANGQTVPLNAKFLVGGSLLDHPGDPSGAAKEIINCRCTALHEIVD